MDMPKLLFIHQDDRLFWTHRRPLARAAVEAGWEVHLAGPDTGWASRLEAPGMVVHHLPLERTISPLRMHRGRRALRRFLAEFRPDIAQAINLRTILYAGPELVRAQVPCAHMVAGLGMIWKWGGFWVRHKLKRLFLAGAQAGQAGTPKVRVQFQNPSDQEAFLRAEILQKEQCSLLAGAGVDLEEFFPQPFPKGELAILFAGRLLQSKGVARLVQASQELRKEGLPHKLYLAGERDSANPDSISARRLAAWQAAGHIELLGFRADMPEVLANVHALCLPTTYPEGVPKILLEAAACGRPAITTEQAGCSHAVLHGETGLLIPSHDPTALKAGLRRILNDQVFRRRAGKAARKHAEQNFDATKVATTALKDFEKIYPILAKDSQSKYNSKHSQAGNAHESN